MNLLHRTTPNFYILLSELPTLATIARFAYRVLNDCFGYVHLKPVPACVEVRVEPLGLKYQLVKTQVQGVRERQVSLPGIPGLHTIYSGIPKEILFT